MLRQIRNRLDWIIASCSFLVIVLVAVLLATYLNGGDVTSRGTPPPLKSYSVDMYSNEIYYSPPPDPKYPPVGKEQRTFYRTYQEGDISHSIEKTEINIKRNPNIGNHIFTVNLTNTRNSHVDLNDNQSKRVTINCATIENPYRHIPIEVRALSFAPYEQKKIRLSINVSCMYLGTADNEYYWRIY